MIVRRSVRFWDPTATPLPLVAPDNGAHVRYGFGDFRPARPEWTRSNPAFVNCLTLHLTQARRIIPPMIAEASHPADDLASRRISRRISAQTPLAIAPVSDWSGPEAILVHATAGGESNLHNYFGAIIQSCIIASDSMTQTRIARRARRLAAAMVRHARRGVSSRLPLR